MIGRLAMAEIKLPYLMPDRDRHGNERYYVRRKGRPKVRIRKEPGTPEFLAAYQAAIGSPAPAKSGRHGRNTFRGLCARYYESAEFGELGESTRHVRRLILDRVAEQIGNHPFKLIERKHVRKMRDDRRHAPEGANSIVKALRQLFKWAVEVELAEQNPARDVPYLRGNPDGHHTWTLEEVEQYRKQHPLGTKARLALELLLFTGTRRSDVVRLGRAMVRDGWISYTEVKNARRKPKHRAFPVLPILQAAIDDTTITGHKTYLVTEHGQPYTANGFGNWFRRRCNEAGLSHCSAHGLRKAGATIAADNGATEHELMAIYDWDSPKQAALYTRKANRKKLAGGAMHLLVARDEERNEN